MFKFILGLAGVLVGCALVRSFSHSPDPLFNFIWFDTPAALMGGSIGLLLGLMLDARRISWKSLAGILGMPGGAVIGFEAVRRLVAPHDSFSGGGLAGMAIGIPVGAMLGCVLGFVLGGLFDKRPKPKAPPELPE